MPHPGIFILRGVDESNPEHVMSVAKRIATIVVGEIAIKSPPVVQSGGVIAICPQTNDWWLNIPQDGGKEWCLVGRNADEDLYAAVLLVLQRLF